MSGDNHDILELIAEGDREKAKKIISTLSLYRPRIEIDRMFQRKLKGEIMEQQKKKVFSWYPFISSFGVLATSFLISVIFWKIWIAPGIGGGNIGDSVSHLEVSSLPLQKTTGREDSIQENIGTSFSIKDALEGDDKTIGSLSTIADIPPQNPPSPDKTNKSLSSTKEDIDIENEISAIAHDMESVLSDVVLDASIEKNTKIAPKTLVEGIPTPTPADESSLMMVTSIPLPMLDIPEYPSEISLYRKSGTWIPREILTRSGVGIERFTLPTKSREHIESEILTLLVGETSRSITLRYRIREKLDADNFSYLIPLIEVQSETRGHIGVPLVEGFR